MNRTDALDSAAEEAKAQTEAASAHPPRSSLFQSPAPIVLCIAVAGLIWLGTVFGRALAPALPGARAGFETWIRLGEQLGAILSQAALWFGTIAVVILLLSTLRASRLSVLYRLAAAVFSAGILTVCMSAFQHRIHADSLLIIALSGGFLAVWAALLAARQAYARGPALVLACASLFGLAQVIARSLALYSSENALPSLFQTSRTLASVGFAFDLSALFLASLWFTVKQPSRNSILLGLVSLLVAPLVWAGLSGHAHDANLFQILTARSLQSLTPHPAPWLPASVRFCVEIYSLGLAACVLLYSRERLFGSAVIALALLTRGSTDIPLCALSLLCAALLAPVVKIKSHTAEPEPSEGPLAPPEAALADPAQFPTELSRRQASE